MIRLEPDSVAAINDYRSRINRGSRRYATQLLEPSYDLIAIAGDLFDVFSAVPVVEQVESCVSFLNHLALKTWVIHE